MKKYVNWLSCPVWEMNNQTKQKKLQIKSIWNLCKIIHLLWKKTIKKDAELHSLRASQTLVHLLPFCKNYHFSFHASILFDSKGSTTTRSIKKINLPLTTAVLSQWMFCLCCFFYWRWLQASSRISIFLTRWMTLQHNLLLTTGDTMIAVFPFPLKTQSICYLYLFELRPSEVLKMNSHSDPNGLAFCS